MVLAAVLSKALEQWGLQVVSLESEDARAFKAAPTTASAFICNLQARGGPGPLSSFYFQAFLDTLRGEGWTIFVVLGKLPASQPGGLETLPNACGRWWSPEEARAATDEAERARKRGRVANALETALARAGQQGGSLQLRTRGGAAAAAAAGPARSLELRLLAGGSHTRRTRVRLAMSYT
ncbi:putative ataxin-3 [Tetrabaena socialis]|uniref:ubiquitinyl hydrolase 1 n=1 Tax=Tetrabaena socialis TaxID=47790 RepID=A0A2J7ZVP4_9CHLO|nr:putative ataxin-3 [Tetrabaena socialis]|eukprot:PNH04353.1 putative ataxin-3 [Tetrabaena socialis]